MSRVPPLWQFSVSRNALVLPLAEERKGHQMQATSELSTQAKATQDRYSYLMMFCALMMVRNSRATVAESMQMLPLSPRVSDLAGELTQAAQPSNEN